MEAATNTLPQYPATLSKKVWPKSVTKEEKLNPQESEKELLLFVSVGEIGDVVELLLVLLNIDGGLNAGPNLGV